MKTTHHVLLVCLALAALASGATAQGQRWIRQFGSSATDTPRGVAPDRSGGMYTCGWTDGSLGGPSMGSPDAWIARHDGAGNQLWIRQLGTPGFDLAESAAPDGSGGVYVCGWTTGGLGGSSMGQRAWIASYDGAGHQRWIHQVVQVSAVISSAVSPDGTGGVFLCGTTSGIGGWGYDVWIARYDAAGNQLFLQTYPTGIDEQVRAAASDGSGGVWVCGRLPAIDIFAGYSDDAFLAHYDSSGNQLAFILLGTSVYPLPSSNWEYANALAPDGAGGVYVVGESTFAPWGGSVAIQDAWLEHYDAAGARTWTRRIASSGDDSAYAAAPDGSGGLYVGGGTSGRLAGQWKGGQDAWLAHLDPTGHILSIRQLGTPSDEAVSAVALDGSGAVFLGGWTTGDLAGPSAGAEDVWVARLP